jgi:hypothetical protein
MPAQADGPKDSRSPLGRVLAWIAGRLIALSEKSDTPRV